jgi:hypothetical protein
MGAGRRRESLDEVGDDCVGDLVDFLGVEPLTKHGILG